MNEHNQFAGARAALSHHANHHYAPSAPPGDRAPRGVSPESMARGDLRPAARFAPGTACGWLVLFLACFGSTLAWGSTNVYCRITGQWPGYRRGEALALQVVDNRAYVATAQAGLFILDVSQPSAVTRLGGIATRGVACAVRLEGQLAYVAVAPDTAADIGANGIEIIDVSTPTNPVRVGEWRQGANQFASSGSAYDLQVADHRVYLADGGSGLVVLDVSNPAQVACLGQIKTAWSALGLTVKDNLAYVAIAEGGLEIYDVSQPSQMLRLGGYSQTSGEAQHLTVVDNLAYLADAWGGLLVLDVSTPTNVVWVGTHYTSNWAYDAQIQSPYAVVANYSDGVQMLDIRDPRHPGLVGQCATRGRAMRIQTVGTRIYVADASGGVQILDASDPAHMTRVGGFGTSGFAHEVRVQKGRAYLSDEDGGLQILNVEKAAAIQRIGSYESNTVLSVNLSSQWAYAACGNSGVQILDVSDPANVALVGQDATLGYAMEVQALGDRLYAACNADGFWVLNAANPAQLSRLGRYRDDWSHCQRAHLDGSLAYVADGTAGLAFLDVSNPAKITIKCGRYSPVQWAQSVRVAGHLAYTADLGGALRVFDVSDLSRPVWGWIADYVAGGSVTDVQLAGNRAYLTGGASGFSVVDISDPTNMVCLASLTTPGNAASLQVVDNRVYIADGYWGLTVVDVSSIPFADSGCKLTNPILKNGSFTFTFSTATNAQYIVESTAGLNPSSWRPLGTNAGTGGAVAFTQTNTATAAGFYRVQVTAQ